MPPCAFFLTLNTHLTGIALAPSGMLTRFQVPFCCRDSISSSMACCHLTASGDFRAASYVCGSVAVAAAVRAVSLPVFAHHCPGAERSREGYLWAVCPCPPL